MTVLWLWPSSVRRHRDRPQCKILSVVWLFVTYRQSYEEIGHDYGVFDVFLEDSINWLELIFKDKSSQFFRFKRKFRVCLDFTSIHSKRIFGEICVSWGGSDAGIVTDETWRKSPEKTFEGIERSPATYLRVKFKHTLSELNDRWELKNWQI